MEIILILITIAALVFWMVWIGAFNDMIAYYVKIKQIRKRWEKDDHETK